MQLLTDAQARAAMRTRRTPLPAFSLESGRTRQAACLRHTPYRFDSAASDVPRVPRLRRRVGAASPRTARLDASAPTLAAPDTACNGGGTRSCLCSAWTPSAAWSARSRSTCAQPSLCRERRV